METTVNVELSPEQVAEAWAAMGSDKQADFYAHLWAIGSDWLCMQACSVANELRARSWAGDSAGRNAYEKLHGHAWQFGGPGEKVDDTAIRGVYEAKREIAGMVERAKQQVSP